jgi:SAM-dependent methyltransferase
MVTGSERAISSGAAFRDDGYRAGPPPEIVDAVTPAVCSTVVDLAAGAGALTRLLIARFPAVFAVEPHPRMRRVLAATCPEAVALDGVAERIPLHDGCADAVLASGVWHWIDASLAIPEAARVLRPGGMLGIIWNRRDSAVPWVADLEDFRRRITNSDKLVESRIRYFLEEQWLPTGAPFARVEVSGLPWHAELTRDEICGLLTTSAGYRTATAARQAGMMREFRDYVHADDRLGTQHTVRVPMLSHYWRATRQ